MGFFSKVWNTLSKLLNFFGKLADAKKRKIQSDTQRIVYIAQKENLDLENLPQYKQIAEEKEKVNKLEELSKNIPSGYDPNYYFDLLTSVLSTMNRTEEGADYGALYTFKYVARTPEWYDLHPVIMLMKIDGVHFEGINFHWRDAPSYVESPYRKYRFDRMQTKFYKIKPDELSYVLKIPTFYPIRIYSK